MLTKYIVYWILLKVVPGSCDHKPEVDSFGRSPKYYVSCDVMHWTKTLTAHSMEFTDRTSALSFYTKANAVIDIKAVRIDTLKTDTTMGFHLIH
jgi:hypothetical protein